jgi:UDP-2,4-diacetamido-2,4,6-trideoxy-beta-L-altropyranose hydrolase
MNSIPHPMKIAFRVDASLEMGTGHVRRCLSLAQGLRTHGSTVSFICRELPGHLCGTIEAAGFPVTRLPLGQGERGADNPTVHGRWLGIPWTVDAQQTVATLSAQPEKPDWLVVDHYSLDVSWEKTVHLFARQIFVIDDLADRDHACDILLDQNFHSAMQTRYAGRLPATAKTLLGPRYALLREEFRIAQKRLRTRDGHLRRLLIFFGGVDPSNETEKALRAVHHVDATLPIDVVIGSSNPHRERLQILCRSMPSVKLHCQTNEMADLMQKADLSIGAASTATWERCILGLPAVVLVLADNQTSMAASVATAGACINLGWHSQVQGEQIASAILDLRKSPARLVEIGRKALELMGDSISWGTDLVLTAMEESRRYATT